MQTGQGRSILPFLVVTWLKLLSVAMWCKKSVPGCLCKMQGSQPGMQVRPIFQESFGQRSTRGGLRQIKSASASSRVESSWKCPFITWSVYLTGFCPVCFSRQLQICRAKSRFRWRELLQPWKFHRRKPGLGTQTAWRCHYRESSYCRAFHAVRAILSDAVSFRILA